MPKLIFFDTETTGNTENDFLIQIAYKHDNESFVGLYKPPTKIPPEASAVHHITNKMVEDKKSFKESGDLPKIKKDNDERGKSGRKRSHKKNDRDFFTPFPSAFL